MNMSDQLVTPISGCLHPDENKDVVMEIINKYIKQNRDQKLYPEGAAVRIYAQLPKITMPRDVFYKELVKAIDREERFYF